MDERRRLNLDALQPDPLVLTFQEKDYEIPGEVPLPVVIRLLRFQEKMDEAGDDMSKLGGAIEMVLEDVMGILRVRQPDLDTLPFSVENLIEIVGFIVAGMDVGETLAAEGEPADAEAAAGEDDTPPLAQAS